MWVQSSTSNRKYLFPPKLVFAPGPHISTWTSWSGALAFHEVLGKGSHYIFPGIQPSHILMLLLIPRKPITISFCLRISRLLKFRCSYLWYHKIESSMVIERATFGLIISASSKGKFYLRPFQLKLLTGHFFCHIRSS